MLKAKNLESQFPLFTAVHKTFIGELQPEDFIGVLRKHPLHSQPELYALL